MHLIEQQKNPALEFEDGIFYSEFAQRSDQALT